MQRGWRSEGEGGSERERRGVPAKLFRAPCKGVRSPRGEDPEAVVGVDPPK
jgi:hypothetical protein